MSRRTVLTLGRTGLCEGLQGREEPAASQSGEIPAAFKAAPSAGASRCLRAQHGLFVLLFAPEATEAGDAVTSWAGRTVPGG